MVTLGGGAVKGGRGEGEGGERGRGGEVKGKNINKQLLSERGSEGIEGVRKRVGGDSGGRGEGYRREL